MRRAFMIKGVSRILDQCLNVKEGENVLIIADTNTINIAEVFWLLAKERNTEAIMLVMSPRTRHGEELPPTVAAAMKKADAIIAPTTYSVNHTQARFEASKAGARLIFLPGCTEEVFLTGALDIDYLQTESLIKKVAKLLSDAKTARVSSPEGTDFSVDISGRTSVAQTGICHAPGSISPPPSIECAIGPVEGTLNGTVVVDGAVSPGGQVNETFRLTFKDGKITEIGGLKGQKDAKRFEELLKGYNHPNVYCAVELGIGMNPNAKIETGVELELEAEFGTMHIGLGNGITFGSSIRAPAHLDVVMLHPTLELDGKLILRDRKFRFE